MRDANYFGSALVLTFLAAVTLLLGIELITMSSNPYSW